MCDVCDDRGLTPVALDNLSLSTAQANHPHVWYKGLEDKWYTWGLCNCVKERLDKLEQLMHGQSKRERNKR